MDYGSDDVESRKAVLSHLLNNNDLQFDNMKQVADFLVIMIGKDRINEIIRSEVDKIIAESYKVGNDKKGRNPF